MAMGETELVTWELRGVTMPGNVVRVELGERGACEIPGRWYAYDVAVAAYEAAVACGWAPLCSTVTHDGRVRVALPAEAEVLWPPGITAKVAGEPAATKPAAEPRGVLIIGTKPKTAADFTLADVCRAEAVLDANRIDAAAVANAAGFTPPDAVIAEAILRASDAEPPKAPSRNDILRDAIADVPDGVTRDAWRAFCAYAAEEYKGRLTAHALVTMRRDLAQYERIRATLLRGGRVG